MPRRNKHLQKQPKRWKKEDNRNAGPHKDKRRKGTRKQQRDKDIEGHSE